MGTAAAAQNDLALIGGFGMLSSIATWSVTKLRRRRWCRMAGKLKSFGSAQLSRTLIASYRVCSNSDRIRKVRREKARQLRRHCIADHPGHRLDHARGKEYVLIWKGLKRCSLSKRNRSQLLCIEVTEPPVADAMAPRRDRRRRPIRVHPRVRIGEAADAKLRVDPFVTG